MKLILHIGTGKTGSSTIQQALALNREALLEKGWLYPVSNGADGHFFLPMLVADKGSFQGLIRRSGLADPEALARRRDDWMQRLSAEVDAARGRAETCILTAEHLCALNAREIARLKQAVFPLFSEVRVLVYLRDPVDYAVSMYDTALKVGGLGAGPLPPGGHPELEYRAVIERWQGAVGADAVTVRLFDRARLVQGDVVADFLDCLGLGMDGFARPERTNESMDLLGEALMLRLNRLVPQFRKDGSVNPARAGLSRFVAARFSAGPKLRASGELAESYARAFGDSNEWVRQRFFPDQSRLFPEKARRAAEPLGVADAHLDEMAAAIADLWRERRRWQARARQAERSP